MMQWYPGHMVKAKADMRAKAALVDAVLVLLDARAPRSSLNPDLMSLFKDKAMVCLLNKSDLADPYMTNRWVEVLAHEGLEAFPVSSLTKPPLSAITRRVSEAAAPVLAREKARGMLPRALKVMIVGIPNVGKSTLINRFAGKNVTKVENRPGVTVRSQWIRLNPEISLLDTPGVLWPKFSRPETGLILGLIGSLKDQENAEGALVNFLVPYLVTHYPTRLSTRYEIEESGTTEEFLLRLAAKKGFTNPRDARMRAATMILADYRGARLGRTTLDALEDA